MAAKISMLRIGEILQTTLRELQQLGGESRLKDLLVSVEPKLNLSDYELETYEKSGYTRWHSIIQFYSIDCVKAGYLQKSSGKWILTEIGIEALKKSPEQFIRDAQSKYRDWKTAQNQIQTYSEEQEIEDTDKFLRQVNYEQATEQAQTEIESHIRSLGPYDFQNLVAELLIAMGYHVPHIAPPGPDGGIDIIAYKDPLGLGTPRIKAQVKHRTDKVSVKEVRELHGLLNNLSDMGLIISSGGFTKDAINEARKLQTHIEIMDLDRLIALWKQHYESVRETGKILLPLVKVYFLAPIQE